MVSISDGLEGTDDDSDDSKQWKISNLLPLLAASDLPLMPLAS